MTQESTTFYVSAILIVLLAYFIQTITFFSPDVGYLLHAANQVLAGGKYGADIFEPNPPMILYLYFPACLFAKWTAISIITAVRLYIILLAIISLSLCFFFLKKLIKPQDKVLRYFLFYTLVFGMLFLPYFAFAQREHILIIFMLPYLLSAALALENKPVHPGIAVLIGVMAGLGFALKPFFLVTPCLVEFYFIIKQRRLFAWVRIESFVIIGVLILYLASIFLWQPDYIKVVLPFVFRYYFPAAAAPWVQIILFPALLFCMAVMLSYLVYCKQDRYSSLGWIIELALLGMIVAFLIARTPWYYHIIPAFILSLVLVAYFFGQTVSFMMQKSPRLHFFSGDSIVLVVSIIIVLALPASYCYTVMKYIHQFQDKEPTHYVADYINKRSGPHSIACFGLGTSDCFPLVYNVHGQYAERFPALWWYLWTRKLEKDSPNPANLTQVIKDKDFFVTRFADDLNRYKAHWVIIDMQRFQQVEARQFDVIGYFLENKKFQSAWQHYRYLTTIKSIKLYERIS